MSGECEEWDEDSEKGNDDQYSLCMILAEEKMRHRDRELRTDPSSGTYNLDQQEVRGGEELERIAVSRKPFRELSCNSNVRTNLVPEDDRKILRRIFCVQLKDDIHSPGEMNDQIIKPLTDRTQGNRVDFVEPQQNKRESTPLPLPRGAASTGPGGQGQL